MTTLRQINSLVLELGYPGSVTALAEENSGELRIKGRAATGPCFPPWPVAPDILYNKAFSSFVGVACSVHPDYTAQVRRLSDHLDKRFVYFNEPKLSNRTAYESSDDTAYLEITWSDLPADGFLPAQLAEDFWYYTQRNETGADWPVFKQWAELDLEKYNLAALEIHDFERLLKAFDLSAPVSFKQQIASVVVK